MKNAETEGVSLGKKVNSILFLLFIFALVGCTGKTVEQTDEPVVEEEHVQAVELRKFPYPYKAMVAISTDIDGTILPDFEETHRFMNTLVDTKMGKGLGLDIANSFWMYKHNDKVGYIDPHEKKAWTDQMSYFQNDWTEPFQAEAVKKYIKAGWIDSIHSFGDFSNPDKKTTYFTREHAKKAIEQLEEDDLYINIWINHGNESNIQNFGGTYNFTEYQQGDDPEAFGYHTDLTIPYGIEFLWDSLGDDQLGHQSVLYPIHLKDGQKVWGYKRYTHVKEEEGTRWLWGIHFLQEQLSEENLNTIMDEGLYSVIAQHLGTEVVDGMYPESAIDTFKRLKKAQDDGNILVARTSRLLEYNRNHDFIRFEKKIVNDHIEIHIEAIDDPIFGPFTPTLDQVRGFTFYVDNPNDVHMYIAGEQIPESEIVRNESDGYRESISIKWFEPDYTDYTAQ